MRKYLWPILVIAVAGAAAGAWVAFPQAARNVGPAVSSFCASFAAETRRAWARLFLPDAEPVVPDDASDGNGRVSPPVPTGLGAIADAASDPEPSSLTPGQRRQRRRELLAAADQRRREVLLAGLTKCPEGQEALKATRAYRAKADGMKALEEKYGQTDDRVVALRIELVALKEAAEVANARYRDWKKAHPAEVVDPEADKLYCDLVARSRFYLD